MRYFTRILALVAMAVLAPVARAAMVEISISNYAFGNNNATVTVHVGDTVHWTNNDPDPHTVTSGANRVSDGKFNSGNLDGGGTYMHTFTETGTFPYYCDYHVGMESAIEVVAAGATVTIDIKGFRFGNNNAPVEINAGDTVVWRNLDALVTHTVTSGLRDAADEGALFDHSFTGNATDPPTFSFTFNEPGTYPYHCRPHLGMNSSIVVKSTTPPPVRGDINGDRMVDGADLPLCLKAAAGIEMLPHGSLGQMDVAPAAGDGVFDIQDVLRIVRFVATTDTTPL